LNAAVDAAIAMASPLADERHVLERRRFEPAPRAALKTAARSDARC
jgi:hypothetical protein